MKKPLVSVVMPVYNSEKYLPEAVQSILAQTYKNFEFIIIDDCSTDKSWKIISGFAKKDKRIRAFRNDKNLKIVKTRNKGLYLCSKNSKYYAPMDSDDICLPKRLKSEVEFMEKYIDYVAVSAHTYRMNEFGKITGSRKYHLTNEEILKSILVASPLVQAASLIRKKTLLSIEGYDEKYYRCQDYDLWFRLIEKGKLANLNKFLYKYRFTKTQGKSVELKDSLGFTIDIQRKRLFKKRFFSFKALFNFIAECGLMLLPNSWVLFLFNKIRYKKG